MALSFANYSTWISTIFPMLPNGWFDPQGPVINAVVSGMATAFAQASSDLQYVANQARISSATDEFLDLCAVDYLGFANLPRRAGESDDSYRVRIQAEILRTRGTRQAMIDVLTNLTGTAPVIFEPIRDAAAFDCAYFDMPNALVGSYQMPFQCYITVSRPAGPLINYGLAFDVGFFDKNNGAADSSMYTSTITDDEIYKAIALTLPAGCTAYVAIVNGPITPPVQTTAPITLEVSDFNTVFAPARGPIYETEFPTITIQRPE